MITLYNENDVQIRDIRIYEINDADMGESTITATVKFDQVMQFHPDWYVLLNGEKYKLGITEPSGKRSTTRINVEYTLTFHSSREDLKRYTFMDFVEYGSGNPQPSQHTFSLQACTLGQLVNRFNINLQYYLGSLWTMELSGDADPNIVADLSFDKASLWDVLLELYNDYGVRWTIHSNEGYMTILVGKDATELQTIFEYGKGNGLISVERTNPTERIVTRLRGKGSEKNLPANYFHAATSAFPIADPDTNSILQGIFYNRLYPKCYRDYVRGYNSGEEDVEETWAYNQGVADKIAGKPMNIVDFAKSDKEALWGISYGAVEDNDEIYPTLQGATMNGVELDKVLAVSPIYVDAPDDGAAARQFTQVNGEKGSFQGRDMSIRVNGRDGGISSVVGISNAKSATADSETFTLETAINTVRAKFLVTPTKFADHYANAVGITDPESPILTTVVEMAANNWNFVERLQLIDATTGDVVRTWSGNNQDFFDVVADDIPAGTYKFRSYIQWYKTTGTTQDKLLYTIDWQLYGCEYASYQNASSKKTFSETFDIWIGNVWNTSKQESESDEDYACRVWAPLVSKEEMTVMFSDGLLAGEDYEFPIVGLVNDSDNLAEIIKKAIHYDTSVTGSHWRLTLQKSDAEFEVSGKYLPNSVINVLPGNHFFFINIQMPYDPYIYDAERRQQEYLENQLSLLDVEQPTFAVVPSSVFMASLDEVDNVVPGNKIRLRDAALIGSSYTTAYIQSISKKYTENKINPDWSLVVSDQILVNGNPITLIEGKVDALSKQMYSSKQAIKDATEAFAQFYLRKDGLPDTSFSATDFRAPVTFRDRITDYNFRQGDFGGYGFGVYTDPDGNRVVEADVLVGRTALRVNELIVNQAEYVGGQKIYSAAAMTVSKVESTATIWRCYFDNKQGAVRNMFLAGDLAFCQRFSGTEEGGYTTYWAKVTAIGSDYIELSKTDLMSAGSGSPAVGDNIIQLGNISDQDRQSAIILSSYGANSPSIRLYYGITDYTLANKDIFGVEYDSTNHIPYFYNYGSMRLGAKEEEDGGYIAYDHKTKQLNINAIVNFLPQSTGLEQMESYQKLVKIAQGNIETWFYDGVSPIQSGAPTMSNYPVNTWEAEDYENHIGDIYYSNTGKGYRFKRSGSTWEWEIISDAEMAQLMAEVQNLQYLKTALSDGTTTVAGGLILTSLIQLGYKDAQDVRHTMAGISGLGQNSTAPAAWFGGPMVDHELNHDATEFAKSLFRFNGTGYLAKGNITWDENGYGQVGGEGDNYALKWNDKEVRIGPNIKLGAGDETIAMLANLLNMFELDTTSVAGKTLIHAKYDGLYSDGDIAAGGAFAGTPSGGGKTYLNELLDVQLATSSLNVGDMLMWNGDKYVNIPQSSITPDLSAYATQQWVLDKKYLTSVPVTSVVGQTGNITAAQVATALTDAGYKLTDTTYELATTTSNGLMSSSDKVKLNNIEEGANKYIHPTTAGYKHIPSGGSSGQILRWSADGTAVWGEDKDTTYSPATQSANGLMSATDKTKLDGIAENANNYTLPTASSSTKGGIKVGTTLSISGEVLDLKSGFPKGTYTKVQIDDYGRVVSGSTLSASDIPNLSWSKITTDKPTTISGYGITDAYTKTETDSKVAALQSLLDSMFERVYDSNNKLIRIHSNVTISSSGDLVAGGSAEGGGTSGGAYTQLEWNAIKALTQSESGLLASAYSVKEAYNELNTAIETLAGKATNVKFTQTLTSGKQIGSISIDGKSTSLYAPASYAWSEITGKPSFATVATSGSYSDLTNKPTIASLMGSAAIGGTSSYLYWNGSAFVSKALGSNAFTSISKVSQLTNDSGYITGITKAMVEGALTGNITSHTHSYIPLSDKGLSNGKVPYYVEFPSYNTLVSLGYNEASTETEDEYYFKGLCKWAIDNFANQGDILLIGKANPNSTGYCSIQLYSNSGKDANTGLPRYCSGTYISLSRVTTNFGCYNYIWTWGGDFYGNAHSSSKWIYARTITLTGSVTGSVSINGSANVTLATTTNHTHTFASLTDKPTTLSGYGITDALPLNGTAANAAQLGGKAASMYFVNNTNRGAVDFDTQYIDGFEYVSGSSTNGGVPYAIIYTANYGDAGMQANFGRDSALQYRSRGGSRWFDWRTVYDDHNANNASTVWSAKRLATPYNLICPYTWARNNDITGTLVLSLPYGFNSMMQCIELTVYDYSSTDGIQGATKFFINGYNYSGNNGIWINPYVFRIGNKNVRVRLGYYNNKCCILIGETNTGWNYPRICVDKVYGSFSESPYAYKDDDWSCAILQDESQITHVKTASDTPLYAPCYTRAGLPYVTDNDVAAKYLKLTGGTMTGNIATKSFKSGTDSLGLYIEAKSNVGARIQYNKSTTGTDYDILLLKNGDISWNNNPVLHSGNYNSYAPKLDGTGATGTWGINISGNAATATNADTLDGYHASYANNQPWGTIPVITSKGWMDVGKHFEFHFDNTTGSDYSTVLQCTGNHRNTVDLPSKSGTLALLTDNVASATKLANSRTIWGQSFNGTGNVSGALTGVTTITTSGQICINTSSSQRNDYNEGIRCNLGGLDNWASVVLGGASGSTNGSGSGVYSLLVHSSLFRIRQNNTEVLCINTSNNVGIGTTSPSYKLHIVGTAYASENIIASGDLTAGSDIRYKDKIQDLRLSVHDIALAPAFTYKWNNREDDALVHIGSSAQYWLNTDAKDAVYYDKQNDFYHLNYASLALCNTIILARSMETQEEKIARLEERIKELEDKLRRYDSCR